MLHTCYCGTRSLTLSLLPRTVLLTQKFYDDVRDEPQQGVQQTFDDDGRYDYHDDDGSHWRDDEDGSHWRDDL